MDDEDILAFATADARAAQRRLVPADVKPGLDVVREFAYGEMRCRVEGEQRPVVELARREL